MSKPTRFEPHYQESTGKWILNLPPWISSTGNRQREFFDSEGAALLRADIIRTKNRATVYDLDLTATKRLREMDECYALLEKYKVKRSLVKIVKGYILKRELKALVDTANDLGFSLEQAIARLKKYWSEGEIP